MRGMREDIAMRDIQEAEAVVKGHFGDSYLSQAEAAKIVLLVAIMMNLGDVRNAIVNYTP